jgi:predicted DNA-binding helix-hairpin-helix protein
VLPPRPAPLLREHRLYQADWLLRFYGFSLDEMPVETSGNLPLDMDPKLAWALAHRALFPIDVNRAPREMLLRIPGMGTKSVARVIAARRHRRLRMADLAKLRLSLTKLLPFVCAADHHPGATLDAASLAARLAPKPVQMALL